MGTPRYPEKINIILRPVAKTKIRAETFEVDAPELEREYLINKKKKTKLSPFSQRIDTARAIMASFLGNIEGWRSEEMQLVQVSSIDRHHESSTRSETDHRASLTMIFIA